MSVSAAAAITATAARRAASSVSSSSSSSLSSSVGESVIRRMTRLALQYKAVNLSQGFPDEPPPLCVRMALAHAVLTGVPPMESGKDSLGSNDVMKEQRMIKEQLIRTVSMTDDVLVGEEGGGEGGGEGEDGDKSGAKVDELNQYSPPMGRPDLRAAIAHQYYQRLYNYAVDPEQCITITLGATEAVASALRTIGRPGDKVVIFEPYHELYPSQCKIFFLEPTYVTLREAHEEGDWYFNVMELEEALMDSKILILNTPHNPTGKVFTHEELKIITSLCVKHDVYIITDEIYEHMTYGSHRGKHIILPQTFPEVKERTFVCNSMGKSASATGWRLGWCLHPSFVSSEYRGVHDQLVVMSPHPMQYAALTYVSLPEEYFRQTLSMRYLNRINMLADALREVGFQLTFPQGAYYLFAKYRLVRKLQDMNPMDAAMYMVKTVGVACVPGDNFYGSTHCKEKSEYLRFAACRSEDDVKEACRRLKTLMD